MLSILLRTISVWANCNAPLIAVSIKGRKGGEKRDKGACVICLIRKDTRWLRFFNSFPHIPRAVGVEKYFKLSIERGTLQIPFKASRTWVWCSEVPSWDEEEEEGGGGEEDDDEEGGREGVTEEVRVGEGGRESTSLSVFSASCITSSVSTTPDRTAAITTWFAVIFISNMRSKRLFDCPRGVFNLSFEKWISHSMISCLMFDTFWLIPVNTLCRNESETVVFPGTATSTLPIQERALRKGWMVRCECWFKQATRSGYLWPRRIYFSLSWSWGCQDRNCFTIASQSFICSFRVVSVSLSLETAWRIVFHTSTRGLPGSFTYIDTLYLGCSLIYSVCGGSSLAYSDSNEYRNSTVSNTPRRSASKSLLSIPFKCIGRRGTATVSFFSSPFLW